MLVALDGSGDYNKLQDAVDSIPENFNERTEIHIKPGVYKQKLKIEKPCVSIAGESAQNTILTFNDCAFKKLTDGGNYGTFNSYTIYISGDDFSASNITFENSAGSGNIAGQALAASVMGDRAAFYNCRFLGNQDTLFTGPLPPKAFEPHGFKEPDEYKPRKDSRQYYNNCFIRGDVDFIFGSATAVFDSTSQAMRVRKPIILGGHGVILQKPFILTVILESTSYLRGLATGTKKMQ